MNLGFGQRSNAAELSNAGIGAAASLGVAMAISGRVRRHLEKKHRAHRIAWIIANGRPIPDGMMVMHSCDNRGCCNPSHLSVGTQQENIKDRDSKGRGKYFGTARNHPRPRAKLTEVSVREIRAIRGDHQTIARMFGVSAKTIGAVLRRDTWTHIT